MPKYLFRASYTVQGLDGLMKDGGTKRRAAVSDLMEGLGGSLETFYYAFGEADLYVIAELPDDASATAASLAVGASGAVTLNTTVLIDPATVDEATRKTIRYRRPGA